MRKGLFLSAICLAVWGSSNLTFAGDYSVVKTLHVGGTGRWDYVTCDPATHRLFVPRSDHTQVIDAESGKVLADITDTPSSHGVALAGDRGFISDGHGVTVIDLKSLKAIGTIEAGKGSDAITYDPASKCIVVMNGRSEDCSFIDAFGDVSSTKATNIPLGGKPEAGVADGEGHVYINIEDKCEIVEIDSKEKKVTHRWKIDGGEEPSGLALDQKHHRLFAGCHNKVMAVVDAQSGKTITTVPIGSGVDACAFDPGTEEAFASCGDSTVTVAKETSDGKYDAKTIQTRPGARTMTIDPTTHTLYLSSAEFEAAPQQAPAGGRRQRPPMKPDSFMIVVVAPK